MRQVRDTLVLRLQKELTDDNIEELNEDFSDLVKNGKIRKTGAFRVESDEPNLLSNPRIAFSYNSKSAGRLTEMIVTINQMGASIPEPAQSTAPQA